MDDWMRRVGLCVCLIHVFLRLSHSNCHRWWINRERQ